MKASSRTDALKDFKGNAVVIGCGKKHSEGCALLHNDSKEFFTIDIRDDNDPDLKQDITAPSTLESLHNRFQLTILEGLPYYCYNKTELFSSDGSQGFKNILDITNENGFIIISGCPHLKEFRDSCKDLQYVEMTTEIILIPKNQKLSIQELKSQIKESPFLIKSLENCMLSWYKKRFMPYRTISPNYIETFQYCTKKFDTFSTHYDNKEIGLINMSDGKEIDYEPTPAEIKLFKQNKIKYKIQSAMRAYEKKGNKNNETYKNLEVWLDRSQIGSSKETIIHEINTYIHQRKSHWIYTLFRPFNSSEIILNNLVEQLQRPTYLFIKS